jgi:hypothetical protein
LGNDTRYPGVVKIGTRRLRPLRKSKLVRASFEPFQGATAFARNLFEVHPVMLGEGRKVTRAKACDKVIADYHGFGEIRRHEM